MNNEKNIKKPMNIGFTMVELAIVIVIIGLLVGGVMQGAELIKQAQIHTLMKQFQSYEAATHTFRSKYNALPGDFNRASTMLSASAYNGNGNNTVDSFWAGGSPSVQDEWFYYWQHLGLGNFIKGSYTGRSVTGANGYVTTADLDVPSVPMSKGGMVIYKKRVEYTYDWEPQVHSYYVGLKTASQGFYMRAMFTPSEMYEIDLKFDDGRPALGKIMTRMLPENAGCVTSDASADAANYTTTNNVACTMRYNLGF